MKRVLPVAIAIMASAALALAGCKPPQLGNRTAANKAAKGSGKTTIVVVPGGQMQAFWKSMRRGVEDAGRKLNAQIVWSKTDEAPPLKQQKKLVKDATAKKVDGIILAPVERVGMVPPIDKAAKAQIPIVILESGADTNNRLALIGSNSEKAGALAARRVGAITGGKGKVGLVINQSKSLSISERELSFENVLSSEFPGVQLVKSHDGFNIPVSIATDADNMLAANPDLKVVVGLDEQSTLAALNALRNRKLTGKIKVVGFEATQPLLDALKQGEIDALLVQDPYQMGYEGVKAIMDYLGGQRPPKRIDTPIKLITRENMGSIESLKGIPAAKTEPAKR